MSVEPRALECPTARAKRGQAARASGWSLRRLALLLVLVLTTSCGRPVEPLSPAPMAVPTSPPPVTFPRDAGPHDVLTEWWYYTGHLTTADGRPYGFEFTVFQIRRQDTPPVYVAHFAISDIAGGRFRHEARSVQAPSDQQPPFDVQGWRLALDPDRFFANMADGLELRLDLIDEKPPALHHGGYIDEGPAGGSYYYSRTRLAAAGDLSGTPVTGLAWMDHQWGNFIVPSSGGWDWYSLQLDDRTEVMLYVLRLGEQTSTVYGSLVQPDGRVDELDPGSVNAEATGQWTSPHTGATYPSGWRLTLPGDEVLTLTPQLPDQELHFGGGLPAYWEGAVSVTGTRTGQGYVELTGYAR